MNKSEQINELAAALVKVQAVMEPAKKDAQGYGYKYTDLATTIETAKPHLTANGLAVTQLPEETDGTTVKLTTVLMHISGQWIGSTFVTPLAQVTPQGMGSGITYARRYSYAAIIGLASEDDDGNKASQGGDKSAQQTSPAPAKEPLITEHQMKKIFALGSELYSNSDKVKEAVKRVAGVEHMKDITIAKANKIIDGLQAKVNQKQAQATENAEKGGQS